MPLWAQAPDTALPIELDADFSELDRRNDRLVFRGLRVRQGELRLFADDAEATPADFENSQWTFRGNVRMQAPEASVTADRAEMSIAGQRLGSVRLTGSPASFEQAGLGPALPTSGRARRLEYDPATGIMLMVGEAWLTDGSNEISGDRITYDMRNERVTADAGEGGLVRLTITPPEREQGPDDPEEDAP
ncbi:MAG: lipopolysaccharide transport periplasmic protein LptA [Chromatiales bacterium]|nr:lipopolysaccharide transport periplasmic protein LptA [Chromatiales bacterium]